MPPPYVARVHDLLDEQPDIDCVGVHVRVRGRMINGELLDLVGVEGVAVVKHRWEPGISHWFAKAGA